MDNSRLYKITALANEYCNALQQTYAMEKEEFLATMTNILPRIYWEFSDYSPEEMEGATVSLEEESAEFFPSYVDEDFYESIRRGVETLLGPEDTFLETFEEDMKYSDTPIAASISESLADIFQPLYNFVSIVRESAGDSIEEAYSECHSDFRAYWSQTLCNVLRPINHLRYHNAE